MTGTLPIDYSLNPQVAESAAIGLLTLCEDATIEAEWRGLVGGKGVEFFVGRVPSSARISPDTLREMEARLEDSVRRIVPGSQLDVLAYACTSATLMIGESRVQELFQRVRPGIAVTNPLTAAKAALSALNAQRIALLTPYSDSINQPMATHFESHGFTVVRMGSFYCESDPKVARISAESIEEAARSLVKPGDVDALFISCTALRALSVIPKIEAELGVPVTSSNQAMAWHALQLAGVAIEDPAQGTLFSL